MFVRLKAGSSGARPPVAHMWELATSKCVGDMIRVPLSPERVLNGALVIVLDLSALGDVVPSLVKWLVILQRVVGEILKAKEKNPVDKFAVDRLRQEAAAGRYGGAHPDKEDVAPISLPVLIVGNKYDAFRDEDPVKRNGMLQAVRYLAHLYGATVLFTSMKDKALAAQFRAVMKSFAFRCMPRGASKEVDPAKPLFVPAGADLSEDIGMPKSAAARRHDQLSQEERARQWKKIASEYFAPSGLVTEDGDDKYGNNKSAEDELLVDKFPEPNIDRVRQQKRCVPLCMVRGDGVELTAWALCGGQRGAAALPRGPQEGHGAQDQGCVMASMGSVYRERGAMQVAVRYNFGPMHGKDRAKCSHVVNASPFSSNQNIYSSFQPVITL